MTNVSLGPLAQLAGKWEGNGGVDIAPGPDLGIMKTAYRETMILEPINEVSNHQQRLSGLRYSTTIWPEGEPLPFHEEVGYWLWDAENCQVMRSFTVPRGYTVLAGGTAEPTASQFTIRADVGSETYGICSNQFMATEFRTVHFECRMEIHDAETFSYSEDTQIKIRTQSGLFHHRDTNRLQRTG